MHRCAFCGAKRLPVTEATQTDSIYARDERGNRIPDFSHCGYAGADRDIPDVPARVIVVNQPMATTDRAFKRRSIALPKLPIGADGFRGAVLLAPGNSKSPANFAFRTPASSCAARGRRGGTTLIATGLDRRPLIANRRR